MTQPVANAVRILELESVVAELKAKVTQAEMHAQAAFSMSSKQYQAAPVSMEDFATFRMGIVMILGERLTDADQNPVSLPDLVTRIDGLANAVLLNAAGVDSHTHTQSQHEHADISELIETLTQEIQASTYTASSHTHPGADHEHGDHSHTFTMS